MSTQISLAKIVVAVVATAVVAGSLFTVAAQRAHAVTLSEMIELFIALDIIAEDKIDEARAVVENQGGSDDMATGGTCSTTFSRNLTVGDTGADVMELQKLLNANGFTVSTTGPGAAGQESMYFGMKTKAAVSAMQTAFAADILTPLGLTSGTGFFGASTRAKANEICSMGGGDSGVPGVPDLPDLPDLGGDDDDDMDDDNGDLSGGEASLDNFDKSSDPSSVDTEENKEDVAVFGFEFDVEDADVSVRRVDIRFRSETTGQEDEPWKAFETVSLWRDGEKIAEENADSEDDWDDEGSDIYEIRFSGLDEVVREGDMGEFVVGVSVGNIDDGDLDQTWEVWVADDGIRTLDGSGLDSYIGDDDTAPSDSESFDIETAGGDTEFRLTTSSENPDASTIRVDESNDTDDQEVLVADLEARDGEVTVNTVSIFATTSTSTLADVFDDGTLTIDGQEVGDFAWDDDCDGDASGSGAVQGGCILFDLDEDDDEFTIDEDEEVEMLLTVDFLEQENNYVNGDTVEFDVDSTRLALWELEDVDGDDLLPGVVSGTANGEEHTLLAEGIFAEIVSTKTSTTGDNDDTGIFTIVFDVTAFDRTFYIDDVASSTVDTGVLFSIEGGTVATESGILSSNADEEANGSFRVNDGDTETFTLKVNVTTGTTADFRVILEEVLYAASAANSILPGSVESHAARPDENFRTDYELINA